MSEDNISNSPDFLEKFADSVMKYLVNSDDE